MSSPLHFQQTLKAPVASVFRALTDDDALQSWFAEHAQVSRPNRQFNFWGRFTPGNPGQHDGQHDLTAFEQDMRVQFTWRLRGCLTTVDLRLHEHDGHTVVGVWHHDVPPSGHGGGGGYSMGDIWAIWLENLRRYLDDKDVVLPEFATPKRGDLAQSVMVDGTAPAVWKALTDPQERNRYIASNATAPVSLGHLWTDWGTEGALEVVRVEEERGFTMTWTIDGVPTVVSWTLEDSGGRTRLTLSHSGFAPDRISDAEWAGWSSYLLFIKSIVEYGPTWQAPLLEISATAAQYYAAETWSRQSEMLPPDHFSSAHAR